MKSVRIRSYSGPHFPAFGLNTERYGVSLRIQSPYSVQMREYADQNNSEYGHFLRSVLNPPDNVLCRNARTITMLIQRTLYRHSL